MAKDRLPGLPKVRYLHGRPGAHPAHARLAEAVGGEFEFVDFRLRWQDQSRSRLRTVASWLVCAATLPRRREHGVFLVDNLHISPVVMKLLFLRRDQKIVVHLGSHTLYFLQSHAFSYPVARLHRWALRNYDALLCEGDMAAEIAKDLLGDDCPPAYRTFIGPPADKVAGLRSIDPDLERRSILFVGSGPAEFRMHYKGLDLMVQAFALAAKADPALEFHVVGDWGADIVRRCTAGLCDAATARITFHGPSMAVDEWYRASSIYLHAARGDAFPLASIEAMHAGLIPIVSEWTGTREIVRQLDPRLVAPLEPSAIAERILWVAGLDSKEKRELSRRGRELIAPYTAEAADDHYRRTFAIMCSQIGAEAGATGGQPPPNNAATVPGFCDGHGRTGT
ncbi:MAG: glycosyltransferase family 4 protein [Solirubrobacterales bacterium]|nr:glycosyltransferase family 4 protein [Solirubrobacterales bacterium]